MILRIACHALITLGATLALTLLLSLTADELITIWLAFLSVASLVEFLREAPAQRNVLDLFERIEP